MPRAARPSRRFPTIATTSSSTTGCGARWRPPLPRSSFRHRTARCVLPQPTSCRTPPPNLLLAALRLAITYGLMGVRNVAHGELIMVGAYATCVVQNLFRQHAPGSFDWYLVCAVPAVFLVSGLVGVALERTVSRRLYGR